MTAPLPVIAQQYSTSPSCHCALIPAKPKLYVLFEHVIIAFCLNSFQELRKPEIGGI
jgi:hypothetical protein